MCQPPRAYFFKGNRFIHFRTLLMFMLVIIVVSANSCASKLETKQSSLPIEQKTNTYIENDNYEPPVVQSAKKLLPPDLLSSEHHSVLDEVVTYDYTYYFKISSSFGAFDAYGEEMLRIRVQEIKAIAAFEEIKKTKAFGNAVKQAGLSSVKGAWSLITHPVSTVTGIPKGVGRFFGRVGEMVKGERGDTEESAAKELIGFSKVKRQYAYQLNVDPYSSNEKLQEEMNSVSWAGYAGGAGVTLLTLPISGSVGLIIKGTSFTHRMNALLRDNAPEYLRKMNREMLKGIGIEDALVEEFLRQPKYSPRHETFLVHALAEELNGVENSGTLISQSLGAEYEEDALLFQRLTEMLAGYHNHIRPIREIIPVRRIVVGYTADQTLIAAIPLDYVYWDERADVWTDAFVQLQLQERPVKSKEIWITGTFSPAAKRKCESKGIIVHEHAGDKLLPEATKE